MEFVENPDRLRKHDYELFTSLRKISTGEWDGVVFTDHMSVQYFNLLNKSLNAVDFTRNMIRQQIPVFFFRKNSILTNIFNRKIEDCQEAGLIQHWIEQFKPWKRKRSKYLPPTKLNLANIFVIVKISVFLYFISCIVFILEVLSSHYARIKRFLDYLTF